MKKLLFGLIAAVVTMCSAQAFTGLPWAPSNEEILCLPYYSQFAMDADDGEFHIWATGDTWFAQKQVGWMDAYNHTDPVDFNYVPRQTIEDYGFPTVPLGDYDIVGWIKRKDDGNFAMLSYENPSAVPMEFHSPFYDYMQGFAHERPINAPPCPDIPEPTTILLGLFGAGALVLRRKR